MIKNLKLMLLKPCFVLGVILLGLCLSGTTGVLAADRYWTGTNSDLWTGNNWNGDVAPVNGDKVIYSPISTGNMITQSNNIVNLELSGIDFAWNLANPVTISGNPLTLSGNISDMSNQDITINNNLTLSAGMGISLYHPKQSTITGNIDNGGYEFNFRGNNPGSIFNLSGSMSGAGFFDCGSNFGSTCNIQAVQTYTGFTRLLGDVTLRLSGSGSLPDSSYVLLNNDDSTFDLNGVSDTIGSLAGSGSVLLGGATLTMGGDDTNPNISGVISENGNLVKEGIGILMLSGNNTYIGSTTINGGSVRILASERIPDNSAVTINTGNFVLGGYSESIGSLSGGAGTMVTLGNGTLTTGYDGTSTIYAGVISNGGGVTKVGAGNFTLTGNNTYTGTTTVTEGNLNISGSMTSTSYAVSAGLVLNASDRLPDNATVVLTANGTFNLSGNNETIGTLSGTGVVNSAPGLLTVLTSLSPGTSPGIIHTGNLILANNAGLDIEIDGINPGTGYDQLDVNGTVVITGSALNLIFGYSPSVGSSFIIIDNDGIDLVTGTFNGLAEGAIFSSGGLNLQITYAGETGNDVVITILAAMPAVPVATAATDVGTTSFTANWNAPSGADGYYLDVAMDAAFSNFGSGGFQNHDVGNVTTYIVTGLSGSTYYYRLRAYNGGGTSGDSNSITTTLDPEDIPTLNEWGMIISSCLLALTAITVLRRREEM